MPFKSEKQRRYLWANEPEIARDWTNKYGSRVRKYDGGVLQNIQSYAMPAWNFAKGIYGNQNPTITDSMRQDLIERAEAKGGDTGTLGYEDYGLNTSTSGGRFAGGITDIINDPHAFANALSLGRVSFDRDPETGEYSFGDTKYDFNIDPSAKGLGANILRGINQGGLKNIFSTSAQAAEPDKIKAMRQDLRSVPAHMRRQTFDNVNFNEWMRNDINLAQRKSTAQKFANLDNRSIQSQKYNDLVSRGIIQDKSLEGYSDWGYRDEEIGKGSKFYDPTHSRIQSILKPVRSTWNKYGKPVMGGIMSAVSGIPGMGLLLNSLRKDPYAANRIGMYGAYKDPSTGFMKDKFGYNVGTTLMKNRFLEPGSNSYRSYALDAMKGMEKAGRKDALNTYYGQTYGKTWDDVKKSHQKKKPAFGDTTLGGYEGSDLGFAASKQQQGGYTAPDRGTGYKGHHWAKGGIVSLWPR